MADETHSQSDESRIHGSVSVQDAETLAASIPADATLATSGFGSVGYPKAVPLALAESDRDLSLTVVSGGSVGEEIDTRLVEAGAIERRYPYQVTTEARTAINEGQIAFHDSHISRLSDEIELGQHVDVDIAVVEAVAVGDDWFVPSLSIGPTPAYVAAADRLIVEINDSLPRELEAIHDVYRPGRPPNREPIPLTHPGERIGTSRIEFPSEKLVGVTRTERRDTSYTFREPTAADRAIAANLLEFLADEIHDNPVFAESVQLQFGVGSLGNALMGALGDFDFGDREVNYYGEVIQDGLLDLLDDGLLDVASATSLALSEDGQERLCEDIDRYAENVVLRPSDISNNPAVVNRFGVVGVNSALEVDLYGHVNSTHLGGTHLLNGIGGSGDFNRNALVPIVALSSTAKEGTISRIVPMVPHVDHTEQDISVVITEQGVADLRGLAPRERAEELVEHCAHPEYRSDLRRYLERAERGGGHIPHDLERAFDWQSEE
ncbi:succinate CoA transferase [Haloferax larsenii JCM 13917]|nr:acetyl-CoA hydrolase/transferase C-terminal domain-containing protein [Haloferax larsenii]ELZ75423.1 succinate CoA transferase [Haloferax larsenii JCM 13917]